MTRLVNTIKNYFWVVILILAFALVYSHSLVFLYNEGDDATSIAYHLLGRNPSLQPMYSAYQGMMDLVLSTLPAQEELLRIISLSITAIAAVCFTLLMLKLVFNWTNEISPRKKWFTTIFVLLAIPELFYFGLVYSPTSVAMCMILCSHLIIRNLIKNKGFSGALNLKYWSLVLFSLLLFGFGVAFRWNTIVYGAIIVLDVFITHEPFSKIGLLNWIKIKFCLVWGLMALLFSIMAIFISQHSAAGLFENINTIFNMINVISKPVSDSNLRMALNSISLLTPGLVFFSGLGFVFLLKRHNPLWVLVLVSLLVNIPWIKTGIPKFMITIIPLLVLCFKIGWEILWESITAGRGKILIRIGIILLLISPWLVGFWILQNDKAWGPGYELRPYSFNGGNKTSFGLTLGSGSAFPTIEGPRPIYGYLDNLIGNTGRKLIVDMSNERNAGLDLALAKNIPVIVTVYSPEYFLDELYKRGFSTKDSFQKLLSGNSYFIDREFLNPQGKSLHILYYEIYEGNVNDMEKRLDELNPDFAQGVLFGAPSSMHFLYQSCPGVLQELGPQSAIVDLKKLSTHHCELTNN